jgi:Asp-tRNA(Asn)/Glu-tRNA(Gln) amidotransferase C subunit
MSDRLSRDEVERIAALASLELTPDEAETFTRQLADILAYADVGRQEGVGSRSRS